MDEFGAYGQRLGDRFRLTEARSIVTRILKKAELAVTEIRGDASNEHGLSDPIPKEDAYPGVTERPRPASPQRHGRYEEERCCHRFEIADSRYRPRDR